jgi:hypothetical protein
MPVKPVAGRRANRRGWLVLILEKRDAAIPNVVCSTCCSVPGETWVSGKYATA